MIPANSDFRRCIRCAALLGALLLIAGAAVSAALGRATPHVSRAPERMS